MTERDVFLAVIDLPQPADRAAYLEKACGSDAGLRERVEALLRSHEAAGSFLGTPAVAPHDPDCAATRGFVPPTNEDSIGTGDGARESDLCEALAFLAPPGRPNSLGRIGHYEVLQVLGRGAFGIVFRAFDDVLQRVVAVKMLSPQMAATSPARKRFTREARSSAQVRHENVVQVYEVGDAPLPFLVMEFIPGETLQQRLNRTGPLDAPEVVRIGRQIAEGLAAAHANDLIHRDIKPGNVLLEGGHLKVKITDFGLARAADDASISQSGIIAGTPMFMAPEQAIGSSIDQRADLFSLGSVLYQMVSGRPPFRANSTMAVLRRVAEEQPRAIREIIPEMPQWLCDIIAKLHAKNPGDRFQTAREVADLLADCEAQLKTGVKLKDFSRIPRAFAASNGKVSGAPRQRAANPGWRKWAVAAALLVPPIAFGIYALARPDPQPGPTTPADAPAAQEPPKGQTVVAQGLPPFSDADIKRIAARPAAEQIAEVREELKRRNPNFDGALTPTYENDAVTGLEFQTAEVTDISPVRALAGLKTLVCSGTEGTGKLTDLTPLRGMQLTALNCSNNGQLTDLSPLKDMPLKSLSVQHTQVRDLTSLTGMRLIDLNCSHTAVTDLSPLKDLPLLVALYLDGTKVTDLTPLKGMRLERLNVRNLSLDPTRDGAILRSLERLEEVNSEPAADFLKKLDAK